jgi:transcriptional regulator SbtR-like protein
VLRELIANLLDDGQANRALKDMLAAEHSTVRAYDPDTADAFATTVAAPIRAAQQNGTINPELHADDIGAILAAGLAAQAHLASHPDRIGAIPSHLLAAFDP